MSSGTTAEPIQPDAPVMNTRMRTSRGVDCPWLSLAPGRCENQCQSLSSPYHLMSAAVITYDRGMGRWEPNARGRLEQAALELFLERGFEQATVTEIARRAGLTQRTFFRYFADKREVL